MNLANKKIQISFHDCSLLTSFTFFTFNNGSPSNLGRLQDLYCFLSGKEETLGSCTTPSKAEEHAMNTSRKPHSTTRTLRHQEVTPEQAIIRKERGLLQTAQPQGEGSCITERLCRRLQL